MMGLSDSDSPAEKRQTFSSETQFRRTRKANLTQAQATRVPWYRDHVLGPCQSPAACPGGPQAPWWFQFLVEIQ
eukprot:103430-Rhodomonas_salina.1